MNLNHLTIASTNTIKAVAFYKLLGLKLLVDALPRYARFECPDGDATFSIHETGVLENSNKVIIYFEDDNLDILVEALQQQGIGFIELPKDQPWLWREAKLEDPDGNTIILFHAGENRKNPPWRIK